MNFITGQLIQTNSGAREHLLFEAPSGKRKTMSVDAVVRVDWSTYTCVIGPTVRGIFPPMTDVTDVNATSRTKDYKLLATGDDFGQVKLFQYPVLVSNVAKTVFVFNLITAEILRCEILLPSGLFQ